MCRLPRAILAALLTSSLIAPCLRATDLAPGGAIVISEISYNPPDSLGSDSKYEFVEVYNRGDADVDLSGWRLKDRDDIHAFIVPAGTQLGPGAYLALARDPASIRQAYGADVRCVGNVDFAFGNDGDTVRLLDQNGILVDQVEYMDRRPWPVEADGGAATLERISVSEDITDFSNFAASLPVAVPGTPGKPNSRTGSIPARHAIVIDELQYNPVRTPDVDPLRHCPGEEFLELFNRGTTAMDLSGWSFEKGIGFTFPPGSTLNPGAFAVLYHNKAMFEAKYGALPNAFGPYERELADGGEELLLVDAASQPADYVDYNDTIPWPVRPDGIQSSLELADPASDNDRGQAWRESADYRGTPGARNSASIALDSQGGNAGPQITRIAAAPAGDPERTAIRSTEAVRVDARVKGRRGVSGATLEYQVCTAGDYIRKTDARFETDWTLVVMGYDADRALWTAVIPALPHRTLVRYRIRAHDLSVPSVETRAPWPQDPEPNLAYFVYDGVPDYVANQRSAFGPAGYAHTTLEKILVYHFIAAEEDIEEAQYTRYPEDDNRYRWLITFVHDGHVHDHCNLRLRSGHRYSWPKRPWKVRFQRGNFFDGVANDGLPYPRKRRKLHFMSVQHDADKPRGESGVFESLTWKLMREAGVIGAATTFVQLRFVRSPEEQDQFLGDFFGIFLETQAIDSTALEDNNRLADQASVLYKFNGGPSKKHPDCNPSIADVQAFMTDYARPQTREWFESNLDIPLYLSFRSIVELSDNHDMDSLKNFFYYRSSLTHLWEVLPWDVDNTFGAEASGDEPLRTRVLPFFPVEYRNRFRFLWQTLFDEKRMFGIVDGWTDLIHEVADADMDRWDTEPREACREWPKLTGGNCSRYQPLLTRMRELKLWIRNRSVLALGLIRDAQIPSTPLNASPEAGGPLAVPVRLRTSAFSDPDAGDSHTRTRWMLIERGGDWAFPLWDLTSATDLTETLVPLEKTSPGREYLFRAAYEDSSGRWSFLSEPTRFTAGPADASPPSTPDSLATESVSARAVVLHWRASSDGGSGLFGYRLRRDGATISQGLVKETRFVDFKAETGRTHRYDVIAVNGAGLESAPSATLEVIVPALQALGGWRHPGGGLDYFYDARPGETAYTKGREEASAFNLDGTWARSKTDDWDGSRLGEGEGAPGGAEISSVQEPGAPEPTSVLSMEDPGTVGSTAPSPNNQRIYFLHGAGDGTLLDSGVTLMGRLRVAPSPIDLPGMKSEPPEEQLPRGQIGISQRGPTGDRCFSIWLDADRLFVSGGASTPVRMIELQSIWATVEGSGGRSHRVRVYLNGSTSPAIDEAVVIPTAGVEASFGGNYLQMGLANRLDTGAIQVDYFGFKTGALAPRSAGEADFPFVRGDAEPDGAIRVDDSIRILKYLFTGEADVACPDAADADDSGRIEITDAVYLLRFVFLRGNPPAPPFPACGTDPIGDPIGPCDSTACDPR